MSVMRPKELLHVIDGFEEVRFAYLFGSCAAGTERASSDLDVAVMLAPATAGTTVLDRLAEALEAASGRSVDLIDLASAPPLLTHEIIKNGKLISSRDEDERIRFVTRAISRFLDTAHLRKVQHRYLRDRVESRNGA